MDLVIRNQVIDAPIETIIDEIKKELTNGKLRDVSRSDDNNISVTCPVHKNGHERKPSCYIYTNRENDKIQYGKVHCFTCGLTCNLAEFVNACFDESDISFGEEWLLDRFGGEFSNNSRFLPRIELKTFVKPEFIDESILDNYNYYHDYMWSRNLKKEVVDTFRVGYDPMSKMLVFPIWDEHDRLTMITKRSVVDKTFFIDKEKDKPIYLLNFIHKYNYKKVYVCESQINALTLWGWGYPAVALIGTGSSSQYDILNKCGIRHYVLCFDGDEAGDKGIKRFIKNMRSDVFIDVVNIPRGKDVNDLTKEEFENLKMF